MIKVLRQKLEKLHCLLNFLIYLCPTSCLLQFLNQKKFLCKHLRVCPQFGKKGYFQQQILKVLFLQLSFRSIFLESFVMLEQFSVVLFAFFKQSERVYRTECFLIVSCIACSIFLHGIQYASLFESFLVDPL